MPLGHICRPMTLRRIDGGYRFDAWSKTAPPGLRREDVEPLFEVQAPANLTSHDLEVS